LRFALILKKFTINAMTGSSIKGPITKASAIAGLSGICGCKAKGISEKSLLWLTLVIKKLNSNSGLSI
jgi:hypothetical protein